MSLTTRTIGESGPRVAFLHGVLGQGRNWTEIAKDLVADPGIQATLVDLPNHGRSPWTEDFSYVAMADTVADELRELAPGEPWVVLGHSMGGKVAMILALRHPDLVRGLVVVDIAPFSYGSVERDFTTIIRALRGLDLDEISSRDDADARLTAAIPNGGTRAFALQNLRRGRETPWAWQANLDLLEANLAALGDWPDDIADPGATYDGPVLWLNGADSVYVQPKVVPAMRALFPATRTVSVKGAGHWVHTDAPEVFVASVKAFLAAI